MHVPLLLQLVVAIDRLDCARAFVGMPSAGNLLGDERRSLSRRKMVCSAEGSLVAPMNSPEPLGEELYGFWAPATEEVPLGSAKDFHVRVGSWT